MRSSTRFQDEEGLNVGSFPRQLPRAGGGRFTELDQPARLRPPEDRAVGRPPVFEDSEVEVGHFPGDSLRAGPGRGPGRFTELSRPPPPGSAYNPLVILETGAGPWPEAEAGPWADPPEAPARESSATGGAAGRGLSAPPEDAREAVEAVEAAIRGTPAWRALDPAHMHGHARAPRGALEHDPAWWVAGRARRARVDDHTVQESDGSRVSRTVFFTRGRWAAEQRCGDEVTVQLRTGGEQLIVWHATPTRFRVLVKAAGFVQARLDLVRLFARPETSDEAWRMLCPDVRSADFEEHVARFFSPERTRSHSKKVTLLLASGSDATYTRATGRGVPAEAVVMPKDGPQLLVHVAALAALLHRD